MMSALVAIRTMRDATKEDHALPHHHTATASFPARNPYLTDSVYPMAHFNPGATDSVPHAGPTKGRKLVPSDVKAVMLPFTSNPTVKKIGDSTIVIAGCTDGIRKIDATGDKFELVSILPYPGMEQLPEQSTDAALEGLIAQLDAAARARDDAKIVALTKQAEELNFSRKLMANGAYGFIDRDGCHYAAFAATKILKSTDDNDPAKPLRIVQVADLAEHLPEGTHLVVAAQLYDGHIAAMAYGHMLLLDRDLKPLGSLSFDGEPVENSVCFDETGLYVVTSRHMHKIVWTGSKLSYDKADGGWRSEYNTMSREQATAAGSLTQSGGSGTTPVLMGFEDGDDKLVIIADGDPEGTNLVAFWRDTIPDGFQQKPGTKSRRIADQIRIAISKVTIEPSPEVLGTGVVVLNCSFPQPVADIFGDTFTGGLTRPAAKGAQKFEWDSEKHAFESSWINSEIDNTDVMVPVISAATSMIYMASKADGNYVYLGLDWETGEERARWEFPDDSRRWNAYGGITTLLENGDLMLGGIFSVKRVCIGEG
ncbi:hypothetical protein G432_17270 [Sphingomonas sp. MM-1]|nr:hypothetical protein G432_17270 [Sphingomonas sp. MM-1]